MIDKLSLLYQQKIFMKANTNLYSTQYSTLRKYFLVQMYLSSDVL